MASCVQCSIAAARVPSAALTPAGPGAGTGSGLSALAPAAPQGAWLCARHSKSHAAAKWACAAAETSEASVPDGAVAEPEIQDPSAFVADVASLIKLVDSRDIVELELKHANYEILIRKSLPEPAPAAPAPQTFPGPHIMAHTAFPFGSPGFPPVAQPSPAPAAPAAAPSPAPAAAAPAPAAPAASANAGLPRILSPMAGNFYRSGAPGEPPFVKVGDRIQKGQVVCIIEAMKLMNEIEADQSGVVAEILVDDGKPVSIESTGWTDLDRMLKLT